LLSMTLLLDADCLTASTVEVAAYLLLCARNGLWVDLLA